MFRSSACPKRSLLLQVEALEDRSVPSTVEYVTGLYNALLHRSPAPAETAGWVDALNTGAVTPAQAALAFTTSSEYAANEIRADYNLFLGRQPAPAELAGWLQPLAAAGGEKQVETSFFASDEFFSRQGGNASAWLNGVYTDVLGRAPDPAGLLQWSQALEAGASRADVALGIIDSPEADSRVVSAAYQNILGRNVDPSGLATGIAQLQQGLSPAGLAARLASSEEFILLEAHGVLDVPSIASAPSPTSTPDTTDAGPLYDVFTPPPDSGVGADTTDQGIWDGSSFDQGTVVSDSTPSTDTGTFDSGFDSSGVDPSSDYSGSDGGSYDSGSDAGDGGSDCFVPG